ncbi:MAG: fatty acid desaturase CarF family protein [Bdellovibrionota bacterium]
MSSPNFESHSRIIQRNSEELAKGYPGWFRKVEWIGISVFFILFFVMIYKIALVATSMWFLLFLGFFGGLICADFFCGLVHWLADTWGSPDIPILGAALIRPFREHHVDQFAMTKHDFIETNAAASLGGVPLLVGCLFIPVGPDKPYLSFVFFFIFFFTVLSLFTNQIHKWAHTEKSPKFIKVLQKWHIILNPLHHQIHHTIPYNKHYCITTGWLNGFLSSIHFFFYCEKIVTKYTGALPRQDDVGESAARDILNGKAVRACPRRAS